MMAGAGTVRIGISGWTYAPWRGAFYPAGLARKEELPYASNHLTSIEVNGTFYRMQTPNAFAAWAEATPDDFMFSVKAPRYITHTLRLRDATTPLANFLGSGLLRLGAKLGPILWQMPPSFHFDAKLLDTFLSGLPHDTEAAARLAEHHDDRLKDRDWAKTDAARPLRHAMEIRHESFRTPEFVDLLRKHDVALVCADTVEWPRLMDLTADFAYCRLHGSEELYASGYDDAALDVWAGRVVAWAKGGEPDDVERVEGRASRRARDVFVYFDNDLKVRAPRDAQALIGRVEAMLGHRRRTPKSAQASAG